MSSWLLRYEGYDAASEGVREVLCALGNGRFATRAAAPESSADGTHYPGTYVAGVFDRIVGTVDGHTVSNESIVNLPDWQSLRFRLGDGEWFVLEAARVENYVQELDLRRGVLVRRFVVVEDDGRRWRNDASSPWPTPSSPRWTPRSCRGAGRARSRSAAGSTGG